jgi:catechol 2,3-dioxygenase
MTSKSMFSPRRFGHANIFISEIHRSMDFYNRVAGLEECFQEKAMKAGFMGNGNTHHDLGLTQVSEEDILGRDNHVLVPAGFGRAPGLFHLAFEVENEAELAAGYEKVVKAGVKILMVVDHTLAKSVYIIDLEGSVVELTADSTKDWRKTFRDYAGQLVTGPWVPGKEIPSTDSNYPVNPTIADVPNALMHTRRTTHPVLGCRDFASQVAFYKEVVGLQDAFHAPRSEIAVLKGTAAPFSLVLFDAAARGAKPGYHHVGYEVPPADIDGAEERLRSAGVNVTHAFASKTKRSVFVRDGDGLGMEFFALSNFSGSPDGENEEKFWMIAE